jgi:carboxymethylenebutenolidase
MMNRREFAGMAAGVAAGASVNSHALAQAQSLGKPHPPLVPEDDPAITVERMQLRRPDGIVNAYAAYPKNVSGNTPGIIIAMHIWGVDAQLRDVVRRYAKAGFSCAAPDLYSRMNAPSGDGVTDVGEFRSYAAQLQRKQYDGDMRAAGLQLLSKSAQGKLGVTGFCMGGHLALIQAIDNGDVFGAVAPFYGAVKDIDPAEIHIPVCGSYGEKDQSIPADDVRTWRGQLRVTNDIRIYPTAGHAFFDDTRSSYVPSAADDAWKRTIKFFKDTLGPQQ